MNLKLSVSVELISMAEDLERNWSLFTNCVREPTVEQDGTVLMVHLTYGRAVCFPIANVLRYEIRSGAAEQCQEYCEQGQCELRAGHHVRSHRKFGYFWTTKEGN